jgi:hypothetical protein
VSHRDDLTGGWFVRPEDNLVGAEVSPVSRLGLCPRAARHCSVFFPALLV